jgi:predicted peptidase
VADSTRGFPGGTGFLPGHVIVDGEARPLWVFIPRNYHPGKKYPAILFLHGLWEKGSGGTNVLSAGLGPVIAEDPDHWPFITVFPQSPGNWKGPERERLALEALDYAQKRWSIDDDRVILAGLSYGGLGVWEIGARHSDRFAALVPVSGHSAPEVVGRLLLTPIWAFASRNDPWVKADNSMLMCQAIDDRGGKARLTEFDSGAHDCWGLAVTQSDLVTWMLRQRRQPAETASATPPQAAPIHHTRPVVRSARRGLTGNSAPGAARALALPVQVHAD